jgi:hypothetical protein
VIYTPFRLGFLAAGWVNLFWRSRKQYANEFCTRRYLSLVQTNEQLHQKDFIRTVTRHTPSASSTVYGKQIGIWNTANAGYRHTWDMWHYLWRQLRGLPYSLSRPGAECLTLSYPSWRLVTTWPCPEVDVEVDVRTELPSRVWRNSGKEFIILGQYFRVVFTPDAISA